MRFTVLAVGSASLVMIPALQAQQSAQFLDAPVLAVPSNVERMNTLCDLDADGWIDAIGTFMPSDEKARVGAFRNDGTGRLVPVFAVEWTQYGSNAMPFPIAAGDFNADGKSDFAVALRDELRVYLSNGAAAPTLAHYLYLGSGNEARDVQAGDYDGNGTIDVAVRLYAPSGGVDKGINVYDKLLTATPAHILFGAPPAGTGFEMRNADVDGDARTDLMCTGNFRVDFFRTTATNLVVAANFSHGLPPTPMGASGDVDQDGDKDVVLFTMAGQYRVLRRTGPTSFVFDPIKTGGPSTDLADVDLDGDLDGVCCGGGGGPTPFSNSSPSWFEIAKNDGTGTFATAFKLPAMGSNHIAGVDDLDQDGDADLVAGRVVYYNVHGIVPAQSSTTADWVWHERAADCDLDGDPDASPNHLAFERNNGDGTFTVVPRMTPAAPFDHAYLAPTYPCDVDGDGDQDILVTEQVGPAPTNQRLLLNNGGGGLIDGGPLTAPGVLFVTGAQQAKVSVGDVDGDGTRDLLVAVEATSGAATFSTRCFLRDANGLFLESQTFLGEYAHTVQDFDGDGFDDVLMSTMTDMLVRYGDGNASLATTISLAGNAGDYWSKPFVWPIVDDLDGDGDQDAVFAVMGPPPETYFDVPRLAENVGNRQFVLHDFAPGYQGALVPALAGDVNGDGAIDLLLGQKYFAGLAAALQSSSVFLGSNAPGPDFTYVGEQWPIVYALGDVDGDDDLDAFSGSYDKGVYFNHEHLAPESGKRRQYGQATAGGFGQKPTFGARGPFVGGGSAELRMTGAAANAGGLLLVGLDDQSAKLGGTGGFVVTLPIVVVLSIGFPGNPGEPGSGSLVLPYTVPLEAVGYSWFHQFVTLDSGAQGGAALSNGLEIYYGP